MLSNYNVNLCQIIGLLTKKQNITFKDYLSMIFKCVTVAVAVAVVVAVAAATASAANKTWIFHRFDSSAMPVILEIWISKIFYGPPKK